MPLYDYDCANCGRRFEILRGVHAVDPTECPLCGGGPVKKAFATPAIHFKGSGWAKKERRATTSATSKAPGEEGTTAATASKDGEGSSAASDGSKAADDAKTAMPAAAGTAGKPAGSSTPASTSTASTRSKADH